MVLSRELPLEEIQRITQESGVETEVFVHGALCMCYSGQCELSAVIGRRSGQPRLVRAAVPAAVWRKKQLSDEFEGSVFAAASAGALRCRRILSQN